MFSYINASLANHYLIGWGFPTLIIFMIFVAICEVSLIAWAYPRTEANRDRKITFKWLTRKELIRYAILLSNLFSDRTWSEHPNRFGKAVQWKDLIEIARKQMVTWEKSGITFTISYWAEVLRLVVQYLDPRSKPLYSSEIWVKIHKGKLSVKKWSGLPVVLPRKIKVLLQRCKESIHNGSLQRGHLIKLKLVLSMLSFFRACSPAYRKVSWDSIVKPFQGNKTTLDQQELKNALKSLGITTLKVGKPSIFWASSKSGPNLPVATLGLGLDLIGWILRPQKWYEYCLICYTNGYFVLLTQFVVFTILVVPVALICILFRIKPLLGHIAVLEEARGKMRKIGITDFWTQILFRPLHDSIYKKLSDIPEDGTNNQVGPIQRMLKELNVNSFQPRKTVIKSTDAYAKVEEIPSSQLTSKDHVLEIQSEEDLFAHINALLGKSNGTDSRHSSNTGLNEASRGQFVFKFLPEKTTTKKGQGNQRVVRVTKVMKCPTVQSLDLTAATDRLPVDVQAQILNILGYPGTLWKLVLDREWNTTDGPIRYSVGQPMGAYSSFAMLALTNHVLVHIAMNRNKVKPSNLYGVLGDDVAIANKKVSKTYRGLLQYLGVEVNPIKGFDGGILEFAKKLFTVTRINISPLGAKNILLTLRNPAFLSSVLKELWDKEFPLVFRLKPRKEIRSRAKRRVRGISIPFITPNNLLSLFSKLWSNTTFKNGINYLKLPKNKMGSVVKFSHVGVILRLASYIGPRSGLWYIGPEVRGYLQGWDYDLYQKIWWDITKRLISKRKLSTVGIFSPNSPANRFVREGVHSNVKLQLVNAIKFQREERIHLFRVLRNQLSLALNLMREAFFVPLNSLPKVRNLYYYKNKIFYLDKEITTLIYFLSLLLSPSVLIVARSYLLNFLKLVPKSISVLWIRFLRICNYWHSNGFLHETCFASVALMFLTRDVWFVAQIATPMLLWHFIVSSQLMKSFINQHVYWSKIWGAQGRNVILDATSPVYDPLNPLQNLLALTVREYKTYEEVPAFKEMLKLVRYEGLVKSWLDEKERVKREADANRTKKQGKVTKTSESSKLVKDSTSITRVKGSTAITKVKGSPTTQAKRSPTTKVSKKRKEKELSKRTRTNSTVKHALIYPSQSNLIPTILS